MGLLLFFLCGKGRVIFRGNLRERPFGCIRMFHARLHHLGQSLQRRDITFFESVGSVGEQLEHADHFLFAKQRHHHDRLDAKYAATLPVDSRIDFRIIAAQDLPGAHAFAGEARLHLHLRSQLRCRRSGAGAANHFALF